MKLKLGKNMKNYQKVYLLEIINLTKHWDGNTIPEYQGIDQSKLVPLLVKTIQELEARITALETNQP
jgi:hypothetical protein